MGKIYRFSVVGKDIVPSSADIVVIDFESNSDILQFTMPKRYGDINLLDGEITITAVRQDGYALLAQPVEITSVTNNSLTFEWVISSDVTAKAGYVYFWIQSRGTAFLWKTNNAGFVVRASYVPVPIDPNSIWPDDDLKANLTVVGEHWEEILINASYDSVGANYTFTTMNGTLINLPASTGGNGGTDLTEVWLTLNQHTNDIAQLNNSVTGIDLVLSQHNVTLQNHSSRINELETNENILFSLTANLVDGQANLSENVNEIREIQTQFGQQLSAMNVRVNNLEDTVLTHWDYVTSNLSPLPARVNDLANSVSNVEANLDQKIEDVPGVGLYVRQVGQWTNIQSIPIQTDVIYIDQVNGTVNGTGSALSPFNSLDSAFANSDNRTQKEVILSPGTHIVSDPNIFSNLVDVVIRGYGASGSIITSITVEDETEVIIPSTASGLSFSNIDFSVNNIPIQITSQIADGSIFFDSCRFYQLIVYAGTVDVHTNTYYTNCSFISTINVYGTGSYHEFYDCKYNITGNTDYLITRSNGMTVKIYGGTGLALYHQSGLVIVDGGTEFTTFGGGYCINSTASGRANALVLISGTTLQTDGSYGRIWQVDPAGYYVIGAFVRNPDTSLDTFAGTRLAGGILDADISATYNPANYEANGNFVYDHLAGIDEALASSNGIGAVGSVANSGDTVTIQITEDISVVLAYATATTASATIYSSTPQVLDIKRISHYDASTVEGSYFDSQTVDNTGLVVDDTIYKSTNDSGRIWIATATSWYEVKYFISGAGQRARLYCARFLPSAGEAITEGQYEQLLALYNQLSTRVDDVDTKIPYFNTADDDILFESEGS